MKNVLKIVNLQVIPDKILFISDYDKVNELVKQVWADDLLQDVDGEYFMLGKNITGKKRTYAVIYVRKSNDPMVILKTLIRELNRYISDMSDRYHMGSKECNSRLFEFLLTEGTKAFNIELYIKDNR